MKVGRQVTSAVGVGSIAYFTSQVTNLPTDGPALDPFLQHTDRLTTTRLLHTKLVLFSQFQFTLKVDRIQSCS